MMNIYGFLRRTICALALYVGAATAAQAALYLSVIDCGGGGNFGIVTPFVPDQEFLDAEVGGSGCSIAGTFPLPGLSAGEVDMEEVAEKYEGMSRKVESKAEIDPRMMAELVVQQTDRLRESEEMFNKLVEEYPPDEIPNAWQVFCNDSSPDQPDGNADTLGGAGSICGGMNNIIMAVWIEAV